MLATLSSAASGYEGLTLPEALKLHDLVLVAKVTQRADGVVTLRPELFIKGRLDDETFELPETWSAKSYVWAPTTLLAPKRYLLMLHRDDAGKPVYSKNPLAESVREVDTVDDTPVRTAAVVERLLAAPDGAARTRVLDAAWTDESDKTKERLLFAMMQMGPDEATVPYLVRCIEAGAPRSSLMEPAAVLIGRYQYRQAVPALLKALQKDDWACLYPAQALAAMKVREAYEPLMALIESPRAQNRVYFIEALCQMDDPRSIPFLMQTARRNLRDIDPKFGTYQSFDVRANEFAVACLGRLRAAQATELLGQIVRQSHHRKLRELAQEALVAIRAPRE